MTSSTKGKISLILIITVLSLYWWQRGNIKERYNLIKIKGLNIKFQQDQWSRVKKGEIMEYSVSCKKEHDRLKLTLPMIGNKSTLASLKYGIQGDKTHSFPLNKIPYLAEYTFAVQNTNNSSDLAVSLQIDKVDDHPVFIMNSVRNGIKVEGEDLTPQKLPPNTFLPRSYNYYKVSENCNVNRLVSNNS